jgi:colicin import membrane protein
VIGHERDTRDKAQAPWKSPVALSIFLHGLILVVALTGWSWATPDNQPPPPSISARLVTQAAPEPSPVVDTVDEPDRDQERQQAQEEDRRKEQEAERRRQEQERAEEARRLQQQKEQERQQQAEAERKREQQRLKEQQAAKEKADAEAKARARQKAEEERRKEEAARKAEEEKRRAEEKRLEAERKRKERERQLKESQLEALADQAVQQQEAEEQRRKEAAAAKARQAQMLTESEKYRALIRDKLMSVWYPPASATSKMSTMLEITLLPTGELASAKIRSGSGNTAFDNSALSAARSLGRYPVPNDQQVFEQYFRRFPIEFNPENVR